MTTSLIPRWHAEHVNFSRLLNVLDEQLTRFHDDGCPDYDLMLDVVTYLRDFGDRSHHRFEDAAFARLLQHDPALRLAINRLKQEHRAMAVAGEELVHRLQDIISDGVVLRSSVEAAAALYLVYYRHHLATEERQILPRAAQLLTPKDWREIAKAAPSSAGPLFGEGQGQDYRELRRHMAAETHA
ncbi:hemerythrin domain-containing protein [Variovorax sp. J22R133]|uniref:hemerythrin domain-containing protein n=1 Tax=Variovorax brevis TaxID=3053503 RepID=UPI0025776CC2|nr:hemerythrin domain-containing protein [Variovorax sp. J22R133]MDM0116341.1 hemerythrin domain-containing protein [Variovorax sp. J22R133]